MTLVSLSLADASAQPGALDSRTLTLADALRESDQFAFVNRTATARIDAGLATARRPLSMIVPRVRFESGVLHTNNPIGAFGSTLQQRRITAAAFDPSRLNNPAAVTNVQSGVAVDLPILNLDATSALRAARSQVTAARASAEWEKQSIRATVVRAYYAGILAEMRSATLARAQAAADATLRQTRHLLEQGLVTMADQMQAAVRVDELNAQQLAAADDAFTARRELGLLLGRMDGSAPVLPTSMPSDSAVQLVAHDDSLASMATTSERERADVEAARARLASANADRRRASQALLPRINGYLHADWNDPQVLYGGGKSVTIGVLASWSLFGGLGELAERAEASARTRQARVGVDASIAQRRTEVDAARRRVPVAREHLRLAQRASLQSAEAHRLVSRRYLGGLATIAELLAAEAQFTSSALAHATAQYALIDALTSYRQARGADLTSLIALENIR